MKPNEIVAERLRVAAYVIDKMRAAIPDASGGVGHNVIGPFAATHEPMVESLVKAMEPFSEGLHVTIESHYTAPATNRVIVAKWEPT